MKTLEARNMTVDEAIVKIYRNLELIGSDLDLENEKNAAMEYFDTTNASQETKDIFKYVFDNYNDLKNSID